MQSSLRIARVDVSGYRLLTGDFAGLDSLHRDLQAAIRRHLPGVTASVLALPALSADGKTVDWYSDLSGQPVALTSLPAARRALVKAKLEDRLASLRRLADELPARVRGSDALAQALRSATHYPGDSHVYAVGDEPVLTLWGFTLLEGHRHGGAIGVASGTGAGGGRGHRAWGWASALVLILALAGGGWYWLDQRQGQSLREALERAIACDCAEPDLLAALAARLDRLEAQGGDYAEIRRRLSAEQGRCTLAAALAKEVEGAGWDCARLAALRQCMADRDLAREPLAGIGARLDERLGACTEAADYIARLEQILGDCAAIAGLDRELGVPPARLQPLGQARERIDRELVLCAAADALGEALSTKLAQCEELRKIDGQLAAFDVSRPPLASIRAHLDAELALCDKAATYRQALVDAQMDCARLRALDERMAGEDASRDPLQSIRRQIDAALEQCKALEKLEQSLRASSWRRRIHAAGGDCAKLQALTGNPLLAFAAGALDGRLPIGKPSGPSRMQVAKQAGARKPKLRVNAIDIVGDGAGRCVAAATGGQVFPATSAAELNRMLRHATQEVRGDCGHD